MTFRAQVKAQVLSWCLPPFNATLPMANVWDAMMESDAEKKAPTFSSFRERCWYYAKRWAGLDQLEEVRINWKGFTAARQSARPEAEYDMNRHRARLRTLPREIAVGAIRQFVGCAGLGGSLMYLGYRATGILSLATPVGSAIFFAGAAGAGFRAYWAILAKKAKRCISD